MRNKYAGTCNDCGKRVEAGAGHFQRVPGRGFIVRHVQCVNSARAAKAKRDQEEDLHERVMESAFPFGSEDDIGSW